MIQGYKQQCENFVRQWLKENASYNDSVILDNYNDWEENFEVRVIHKLGFNLSRKIRASKKGSYGEKIYLRETEYEDAIRKLAYDELASEKTFRGLSNNAQKAQYGEIDTLIRRFATDIQYGYECPKCWGKGQNQCHKCFGKGQMPCNYCNGSGRIRADSSYKTCHRCHGRGMSNCLTCSGSGWTRCSDCNGEGGLIATAVFEFKDEQLYYINSINSKVDDKIKKALDKIGAENFAIIANEITAINFKENHKEREAIKDYKVNVPFAKFNITINGKKYQWLVFGKNIQIDENDNILKELLDNNIKALEMLSKISWLKPILIQNKVVKNITNAKFIRNIAKNGNFKNDKNTLIFDKTDNKEIADNKLFDWQFIQIIFKSLHRIASVYFSRVHIFWYCLAIITSICALKISDSVWVTFFVFVISIFVAKIFAWIHTKIALRLFWGKDLSSWANKYHNRTITDKIFDSALEHWIIASIIVLIIFGGILSLFSYIESVNDNKGQIQQQTAQKPIKLVIKGDFINVRQSPNGKVVAKIYKKDSGKFSIKILNLDNKEWAKVLYLPPNEKDKNNAITGYIHSSHFAN